MTTDRKPRGSKASGSKDGVETTPTSSFEDIVAEDESLSALVDEYLRQKELHRAYKEDADFRQMVIREEELKVARDGALQAAMARADELFPDKLSEGYKIRVDRSLMSRSITPASTKEITYNERVNNKITPPVAPKS